MRIKIIIVVVLNCMQIGYCQLPPIFNAADQSRATSPKMVTTYMAPKAIIWQNDSSGTHIQNAQNLLQKGNGQLAVNDQNLTRFISDSVKKPAILLDFGKELHGGLKISMGIRPPKTPLKLRIRFGESVGEAMSEIGGENNATNDHSLRDFMIEVPWLGSIEVGDTGFRFVRIDVVDSNENAPIKSVEAAFKYRDLDYLGSFNSSDQRLNEIWMTGAYTVHLNMQNYLWDGIKRDRLVWVGDMHPEVMTINSVFGYNDVVPKSLDLARDQHPLPQWMNSISSYSMWWILIHKNWYDYHGNLDYLKEQEYYMVKLLEHLSTFVDSQNREKLDGVRFLDWPTSEIPGAVHAGLQAMMVMTFKAGSEIMDIYNKPHLSKKYSELASAMRKHKPKDNTTKQAAALLALSDIEKVDKINEEFLTKNGVSGMSTFYGYYMLEAMAKANDYKTAMDVIRKYWGGMLDLGATTFWEDFDINDVTNSSRIDELTPEGMFNIHGDFGEYCYVGYRHSLAHGWASGPTAWLSQYVLGVNVSDGGDTVTIKPHLGDLEFAEGTFPTKFGVLQLRHEKDSNGNIKTTVNAPEGLKVLKN